MVLQGRMPEPHPFLRITLSLGRICGHLPESALRHETMSIPTVTVMAVVTDLHRTFLIPEIQEKNPDCTREGVPNRVQLILYASKAAYPAGLCMLQNAPCHVNATGRCMGERVGDAAAVTDHIKALIAGL